MALDAAQNGKGFEDEVDLDLTHTPPADGGSDVKRRLALELRERDVRFITAIIAQAVDGFMIRHVAANDGIFEVEGLPIEQSLTKREHIRLQAQCAALLRRLFAGNAALPAVPAPRPSVSRSIETFKADIVRGIAERMVDHVIKKPENGALIIDTDTIRETTESIMQSIFDHQGMIPPESIIKGFLSGGE